MDILTSQTTAGTILGSLSDVLPLINSYIGPTIQKKEYKFKCLLLTPSGPIQEPQGIAVTQGGEILVVGGESIYKFNANGEYLDVFSTHQIAFASGIAVAADGRVYVTTLPLPPADVVCFDRDGNYIRSFGRDHLAKPYDLTVDAEGNILVIESFDNEIHWFSPDGEWIKKFERTEDGWPVAIRVSQKTGDIFVFDQGAIHPACVKVFDSSGTFKQKLVNAPVPGSGLVDALQNIAVFCRETKTVKVFNSELELLFDFGLPSEITLEKASADAVGMALHQNGNLIISLSDGNVVVLE